MRRAIGILAVGIAALNHEAGDDPMKGRALIEALLSQLRKVLHMARRHIMKKSQYDLAQLGSFAADSNRGSRVFGRL